MGGNHKRNKHSHSPTAVPLEIRNLLKQPRLDDVRCGKKHLTATLVWQLCDPKHMVWCRVLHTFAK